MNGKVMAQALLVQSAGGTRVQNAAWRAGPGWEGKDAGQG